MKRKTTLLICCALLAVQAIAQTKNKKEVLPKEKKQTTISIEFINTQHQPIDVETKLMLPELKESKVAFDSIIFHKWEIHLAPMYYENSTTLPFNKKFSFYLESEQKQYLNLASYNLACLAMSLCLNSKLYLTGGLLAAKQFSYHFPYSFDRSGVRLYLKYPITEQLNFNIWGQYLTDSSLDSPVDIMLPQTGAGASMVLDLGGRSQFGVGADYQRDDKKEKWNYNAGGRLKFNF